VPEVRVIGAEDQNLGVMKTFEAIKMAREAEMDLVEINPKASPPVCKIVEFSHFKYQKEKEAKKQRAGAHESETKGIRLSIRIGDHDLEIRVEQATKFLDRGDKVKAEIILRGRENAKPSIAFDVLKKFQELLAQKFELRVEQPATKQGNKVTSILAKK
jgi:translation initiation factor IF-3